MKISTRLKWAGVLLILVAGILRLFHITQSPPSLYWEEVALGYDAYSLLITGKDHHGNPWPIVAFESFGDWKPSGYFYALLPFIRILGLTEFSVRLPAFFAGVGIVIGMGVLAWLTSESVFKKQQRLLFALVTGAVAAVSPWLITFSRAAWEVNLATFCILWGVIFGWCSLRVKDTSKMRFTWLLICVLFFCAAIYTYHSARVLAPILLGFFGIQFVYQEWRLPLAKRWWIGIVAPFLLVVIAAQPFLASFHSPVVRQRLAETSILNDISLIEESNFLRSETSPAFLSRILYHRYVLFAEKITGQFFDHFRLDFLFVNGDTNPRHSIQYFGLFYPFEILFLVMGAWFIRKKLPISLKVLCALWIFFGILPAALSKGTPHALRILPVAPVFILIVGYGLWEISLWFQKICKEVPLLTRQSSWITILFITSLYILGVVPFYRHLLTVYPQQYANEWQYGYKEMITALESARRTRLGLPTYVSREYGRPAMYYWFFTKTDPSLVQQANKHSAKDQGEFIEFGTLYFIDHPSEISQMPALVAGPVEYFEDVHVTEDITTISDPQGEVLWRIAVVE